MRVLCTHQKHIRSGRFKTRNLKINNKNSCIMVSLKKLDLLVFPKTLFSKKKKKTIFYENVVVETFAIFAKFKHSKIVYKQEKWVLLPLDAYFRFNISFS